MKRMFSTPDGANVAPTPESSQPVAGSGHLLNQVVDTTIAVEPGVWEVTAVAGSVVLGWATTATAANIGFVCPVGQSILIVVPATQAHIHYRCLADYTVAYLRKVKEGSNTTLGLTPPAPSADPEPMNVDPGVGNVIKDTEYTINSVPLIGTFDEAARNTDPGAANVLAGTPNYKILNVAKVPSYTPDFPAVAAVLDSDTVNGSPGTYHAPAAAEVVDTAVFGPSSITPGTVHLPEAAEVLNTAVFGPASAIPGTFDEAARNTDPTEAKVLAGTNYKIGNVAKVGTLPAADPVYSPVTTLIDLVKVSDDVDGLYIQTGDISAAYTNPATKPSAWAAGTYAAGSWVTHTFDDDDDIERTYFSLKSTSAEPQTATTADWRMVWVTADGWKPLCEGGVLTGFRGHYDGGGHKITGLYINRSDNSVALFTRNEGLITNVVMDGGSITTTGSITWTGALVAVNAGVVSGCSSNIPIEDGFDDSHGGASVGGLCGANTGIITTCSCSGVITSGTSSGDLSIGGFVGYNTGTITTCSATGDVSGIVEYCGGFIGWNAGTISTCFATGDVVGTGGFSGQNSGTISSCYTTGPVATTLCGGGFTGWNAGTINLCYATGAVSIGDIHSKSVGGFVGVNAELIGMYTAAQITMCYSTGNVSTLGDSGNIGGFVGFNRSYGQIDNCFATGDIDNDGASNKEAGFVASNGESITAAAVVDSCYATGVASHGLCDYFQPYDEGSGYGSELTKCFWDTTTSGTAVSHGGGTGFATADMVYDYDEADPQPPANAAAAYYEWNFTTIWNHGTTSNYPVIRGI
jgi:hypothetical protein